MQRDVRATLLRQQIRYNGKRILLLLLLILSLLLMLLMILLRLLVVALLLLLLLLLRRRRDLKSAYCTGHAMQTRALLILILILVFVILVLLILMPGNYRPRHADMHANMNASITTTPRSPHAISPSSHLQTRGSQHVSEYY